VQYSGLSCRRDRPSTFFMRKICESSNTEMSFNKPTAHTTHYTLCMYTHCTHYTLTHYTCTHIIHVLTLLHWQVLPSWGGDIPLYHDVHLFCVPSVFILATKYLVCMQCQKPDSQVFIVFGTPWDYKAFTARKFSAY